MSCVDLPWDAQAFAKAKTGSAATESFWDVFLQIGSGLGGLGFVAWFWV